MGILSQCLADPTVGFYPLQREHCVSTPTPLSLLFFPRLWVLL